jgi:hypothetical protein
MMNPTENVQDALKIVPKLIERTREGKLQWHQWEHDSCPPNSPSAFITFADRMRIVIAWEREAITLRIEDGDERLLILVTLENNPKYGYDQPREGELYVQMAQLLETARRSTGDIERKVAELDNLLDRL